MLDLDVNILDWVGSKEREVIEKARYIIRLGPPPSDREKGYHRQSVNVVHDDVSNLMATIYSTLASARRQINFRKIKLVWEDREYEEYPKSERERVALALDNVLTDLSETVSNLEALYKYLEDLGWRLKSAAS